MKKENKIIAGLAAVLLSKTLLNQPSNKELQDSRSASKYNPRSASKYNPRSASNYNPRSASNYNPRSASNYNPRSASNYKPNPKPEPILKPKQPKNNTKNLAEVHMIMCGGEIREADNAVIAAFEASHPGVTVNAEAVPWGTCQDKSMTLAAAGDPVGLAYMGSRTLKQLARSGLIVPVDISDEQKAMYQPGVLATVSDGGKIWGFPHAFSTKALFINCGLVEEAGLACVAPKTWTDMYAMAKAINDNTSAAGIGLAAKDFDNTMHQFLNYLYSNGGSVNDADTGEITFNSPETIETLEFYGKLAGVAQEGPMGYDRHLLTQLYNDGQIGMYINGPWGAGQHNDNIAEIVVPIPAGPSGSSGTLLITDSIVVFKGSANEDLAMELARMLSSGEAQYDLDKSWGLTPIMQYEKMMDDVYYDNDYWQTFVEPIGRGGPEPMFEEFKALQAGINGAIQGIILGEGSAADLVAEAAEILAEGN